MTLAVYILIAVLVAVALALALVAAGRALLAFVRFRGTRVITCPENHRPAAVEVDARQAGASAALGAPQLRLRDCSRWPEKRHCGQACLAQIEIAPEDCLVRTILTRWYQNKTCALCGKPFGDIHWHDHRPALFSPEKKIVEWRELQPETVPAALETHRPVCWDCLVAETFRRRYPDLVVDRDPAWFSHSPAREKRGKANGH